MINNSPQTPQNPAPVQAPKQRPAYSPSFNAVQINLDTPTLNAPQPGFYYDYPTAEGQPYYPPVNTTPAPGQQPAVAPNVPNPSVEQTPTPAQTSPVDNAPKEDNVNIDEVLANLSSADFDKQAAQMNDIAEKGFNNEAAIVPYVQEEVFNKLMNIMDVDSSKLPGPTDQQLQLRAKVAQNDEALAKAEQEGKDPKTVQLPNQLTPDEENLARSITPFEQAERNKEYALFTTALLQKTYGDEIEKRKGDVVPLTDLPGAAMVVDTLKNDKNPAIRTAAIDALRFVKRPEYKDDLTKLFTIAQSDADDGVASAAKDALDDLNNPPAEGAQPQPAAQQTAQA